MKYLKYFLAGLVAFAGAGIAIASVTSNQPTQQPYSYQQYSFLSATTTTATSTNLTGGGGDFIVKGAKRVTFYFTHGGTATTSTGGATFKVEASRDGSTFLPFNKLIGADVSSTATSTVTILGATTTVVTSANIVNDTFYSFRCVSTKLSGALGVDGESTCTAAADF